jgi:phage regulator Rha-like protein
MRALSIQHVDSRIRLVRGHRVILDSHLAELYGVTVKRLNEQIKRNRKRFPADFMLRLTRSEAAFLRSQNATSKNGRGGRRYRPFAFTEHGTIMAATVLNSERATKMSIFVVRAFIRMREAFAANEQILSKLAQLERRLEAHDSDIQQLVEAIRALMTQAPRGGRRIGFALPPASTTALRSAS